MSRTQEQQPQSIVHHLSRMGSKMAIPFRKQLSPVKSRRQDDEESLMHSKRSYESLTSRTEPIYSVDGSNDDWSFTSDCYDGTCRQHSALHEEDEDEGSSDEETFISLDQNEFLMECFMTNQCSDVTFIVIFSAGTCYLSKHLEEIVAIRTAESGCNCQCRRVDSRKAPMFTQKLQIDVDQPTLVAMKNGSVIGKMSNISPSGWELDKWLTDTNLMTKRDSESDFQSLSTRLCDL
ncbi:unnamed protein product [Cylindrotheca closterium]|uniref:Phosducin thioredoxin-like domain-containing protein n=1 Tax=Cylindrotheca closterium TaxID=2856 RepID=A0AAD2G976_9STRA|nr:unnamed protein product [Cylindrotheca closterium]